MKALALAAVLLAPTAALAVDGHILIDQALRIPWKPWFHSKM